MQQRRSHELQQANSSTQHKIKLERIWNMVESHAALVIVCVFVGGGGCLCLIATARWAVSVRFQKPAYVP